ncbi:Alanyl-tRNA editing protein AlaX-M [Candidatus Anstonella stagnisolia]|nr:Alanyl-tRNA editing protein AlaX-M [Candidatus Anstonella stagnisolia]
MANTFYLEDSYAKSCDAKVEKLISPVEVVLSQNLFYPRGGGQPTDTGKIMKNKETFIVSEVSKKDGEIICKVDKAGLTAGDSVTCELNWERRYRLMRSHTAAHILSTVMQKETGALITGNQLDVDKTRFDFSLENFDRTLMDSMVQKANFEIAKNANVKIYSLPREEAMKIEGIVKLASALPPAISILRIVEIEGIDTQADGGTHVKNTSEIGKLELVKMENKGAQNRRIYFKLMP